MPVVTTIKYRLKGVPVEHKFVDKEAEAQAKAAILVMHGYRVTVKTRTLKTKELQPA